MVTYSKGIPDDTPENTVRAIRTILEEEARELGAIIESEEKDSNGAGIELTVDMETKNGQMRVILSCIKGSHVSWGHGTIGEGFISWGSGGPSARLVLEMFHGCPPYRWSIYPGDTQVGRTEPTDRFLTGTCLRAIVREKLQT
jgi:hypothetical protein